jgi:translation initiation factor IF-1
VAHVLGETRRRIRLRAEDVVDFHDAAEDRSQPHDARLVSRPMADGPTLDKPGSRAPHGQ